MSLNQFPTGSNNAVKAIFNSDGTPVTQRSTLQLPASIVATDSAEKEATVLAFTTPDAAVTLAKMAPLAANSVIGNSTGSAATPTALSATAAGLALLGAANVAAQKTILGISNFSPDQIVGLVRWHDGATGLTASSWTDLSPVGSNLDQVNGGMTVNAGINSIPGITGSGGNFLFCSRADVAADAARTVFVVHTAAAGANLLYATRSQTGFCLQYGTDSAIMETNNVVINSVGTTGAAGNHITEAVFGGIAGNKPVILVDGVALSLTTTGGTGVGTETGSADTRVGRTAGTICAVLVFNSALSASNRALVRAYLASRFAITAA